MKHKFEFNGLFIKIDGKDFPFIAMDDSLFGVPNDKSLTCFYIGDMVNKTNETTFEPRIGAPKQTDLFDLFSYTATDVSLELVQDISCMHGLNMEQELFTMTRLIPIIFNENEQSLELYNYMKSKGLSDMNTLYKFMFTRSKLKEIETDFVSSKE